ncbi:hypothetical protein LWI29_015762 [Acer saccharum]|uniref:Uncharacterized protein n=1 Tax=Acer saccharum TaxID=4024 RepID=A0AA39SNX1_ACESA|nr:hypothetical protein LWI29_015762 [Acer saccharum]
MHAKAFEYGKHDNFSKHVKNVRKVKNAYPSKFDHACVANNVEKKSINDIIVNKLWKNFTLGSTLWSKRILMMFVYVHPRQNLSRQDYGKSKKDWWKYFFNSHDKSKPTISSKISKANKVDELGIFGCKKLIQERGIDLDSCVGSYVYDVLKSRNWNSWVNMLGISNETVVREFYHAYKSSSTVTSATLSIRKVVFRVCSRKVNEFLDLPDDIESEFLDVDILENLDLMGRTLCDDSNFVWGKRAYIKQACTSRLDKKLAFPGFITQLCLAKGVRNLDSDVMLPPLEKLSEKRVAFMSYKDRGKSNDVFRLFSESLDSNHVPSSPALPSWALKLRNEVEESRRLIEASQRKIEDLSAKLVVQDERIKELEGKSTPTRQYVRSAHHSSFLGGTSG